MDLLALVCSISPSVHRLAKNTSLGDGINCNTTGDRSPTSGGMACL